MLLLLQDKSEASLNLNHSVPVLKKLGLPANATVTINSESHGNGSYFYIFSSSAGQQKVRALNSILKLFFQGMFGQMLFQTTEAQSLEL